MLKKKSHYCYICMINAVVATQVFVSISNRRIFHSLQYIQKTTLPTSWIPELLHTPFVWKVSKDRTEMKVKGK